jgi:hypothetical protein
MTRVFLRAACAAAFTTGSAIYQASASRSAYAFVVACIVVTAAAERGE